VRDGAQEIDIVITREHVLTGDWQALYDEVRDFRAVCGNAHLKTILATGDLKTLRNVAKASMVCDDGRRRLHQDLDRQGRRQRDAAGDAGDAAR
jgi:deoxyribose-phosphate aldolase